MKKSICFLVIIIFIFGNLESNHCNAQTLTATLKGNSVIPNGICERQDIIDLGVTTTIINPVYSWNGPSGFTSTSQNPKITAELASNGTYTATIKGNLSAGTTVTSTTTATITITVNPKPSGIKTNFDITGKSVTLLALGGQPSYTYSWTSPTGNTSTSKIFENPNTSIDELGVYKLVVTDPANGCTTNFKVDITKSKDEKAAVPVFGTPQDDEEGEKVYNYIFSDRDCALLECDINGKILDADIITSYPNCKFTLIAEFDDYVIIKCWRYTSRTDLYKIYNKKDGEYGEVQKYFRFSKNDLLNKTRKYRNSFFSKSGNGYLKSLDFTAGVLTLPIKLRCSPEFEFSKDVTIGSFIGARTRLSHYKPIFVSLGIGIGISALSLNSKNSTVLPDKPQDVPAFTYTWGAVFEFDKVQIGLLLGKDNISDYSKNGWKFQNETWFSVGFGYSILSRPSKTDNKAGTN